jgi:hypothetical protein
VSMHTHQIEKYQSKVTNVEVIDATKTKWKDRALTLNPGVYRIQT